MDNNQFTPSRPSSSLNRYSALPPIGSTSDYAINSPPTDNLSPVNDSTDSGIYDVSHEPYTSHTSGKREYIVNKECISNWSSKKQEVSNCNQCSSEPKELHCNHDSCLNNSYKLNSANMSPHAYRHPVDHSSLQSQNHDGKFLTQPHTVNSCSYTLPELANTESELSMKHPTILTSTHYQQNTLDTDLNENCKETVPRKINKIKANRSLSVESENPLDNESFDNLSDSLRQFDLNSASKKSDIISLALKLPNGSRFETSMRKSDTLHSLQEAAELKFNVNLSQFEFIKDFPRQLFDKLLTLDECGLEDRCVIYMEDMNYYR